MVGVSSGLGRQWLGVGSGWGKQRFLLKPFTKQIRVVEACRMELFVRETVAANENRVKYWSILF